MRYIKMSLNFQKNRFLSEFSTFGIGGPIDFFASIETIQELEEAYAFCRVKNLPVLVLGKGSNCLFSDRGFRGVVLQNKISFCHWKGNEVEAGAGYSFSLLGSQSVRRNLMGLEFAAGIPASVGGAIFMNAGANGGETVDSLLSIAYFHFNGRRVEYQKKDLEFSYRFSSFQKMEGAIISAKFELKPCLKARERQLQIIDYRKKTQPLKDQSIGCIFRNPSRETSAGALIEKCGLKGLSIGGAKVSEMHANFIVNQHQATSEDIKLLIREVLTRVYEKTGIELKPEIKIIDDIR